MSVVLNMFPHYERIAKDIHVRISEFPLMEDLFGSEQEQENLNKLIKVKGTVTSTSEIFPRLSMTKYDCARCGYEFGPCYQPESEEIKPNLCPECQSRGPFEIKMQELLHSNYQRITIKESVSAPNRFLSKVVILTGDLCDASKYGEQIELTGVFMNRHDFVMLTESGPIFSIIIIANNIKKTDEVSHLPAPFIVPPPVRHPVVSVPRQVQNIQSVCPFQ